MGDRQAFVCAGRSLVSEVKGCLSKQLSTTSVSLTALTPSSSMRTSESLVAVSRMKAVVFISRAYDDRFASGSSSLDSRVKILSRGGKHAESAGTLARVILSD